MGLAAARVTDNSICMADLHGNECCPHTVMGPAQQGSPNVFTNGLAALRQGDRGIHAQCCGPNTWQAAEGSSTVFINGLPAVRRGDETWHCGGEGLMVDGSSNVFIGE